MRIHRSALVNLDRVKELRLHFKGSYRVVLADGTQLPLGRHRRGRLEALWGRGK
ncbi:MAG TPA: LytTR family DNA-binding domain-containing protein [Thermoanaerobaculia bacterium]